MRPLLAILLLLPVMPAIAQETKSTHRQFRSFRIDFAGSFIRFVGKDDPNVQASKEGYGLHLQPGWNITDNHNIGIKTILSNHAGDNSNSFSVLANYSFTYYGKDIPNNLFKLVGIIGGIGVGACTGPAESETTQVPNPARKTSFAIMPRVGFQFGKLYADGHIHFAAGDKHNTYLGISVGALIGGGFRHK